MEPGEEMEEAGERFVGMQRLEDQMNGSSHYRRKYKAVDVTTGKQVLVIAVAWSDIEVGNADEVRELVHWLAALRHPQIARYIGCFSDPSEMWVVREYFREGTVYDLMQNTVELIEENLCCIILKQALLGLQCMHRQNRIHRDIQAASLFVKDTGEVKLGKFSRLLVAFLGAADAKRGTIIGTPYWMAPEVIQQNGPYDEKVDIWSLGITAIELATGAPPLAAVHPMRALFQIPSSPSPTLEEHGQFSPEFRSFVDACLVKYPAARWSAGALLQHPFICTAGRTSLLRRLIRRSHGMQGAWAFNDAAGFQFLPSASQREIVWLLICSQRGCFLVPRDDQEGRRNTRRRSGPAH